MAPPSESVFKNGQKTSMASLDLWLKEVYVELKAEIALLLLKTDEQAKQIQQQQTTIDELKKAKAGASYASLFSSSGKKSEEHVRLLASVATESRLAAKTENNLVINGLTEPTADDDEEASNDVDVKKRRQAERERLQLATLLNEIGANIDDVVSQSRIRPANKTTTRTATTTPSTSAASTSTSSTDTATASTSPQPRPAPLLVQFRYVHSRDQVVQSAKALRANTHFKNVYIDIDKTQAERTNEYNERKKRDAANAKLPSVVEGSGGRQRYGTEERNGKQYKYFYCIRSGVCKKVSIESS